MRKTKAIAIIVAAGMLAAGCGTTSADTASTADTESAAVASTETADDAATEETTEDTSEATVEDEMSAEETANELFRKAINSDDYLTDGTYRLVLFCDATPVSAESSAAKDAKGTNYTYLCRYKAEDAEEVYCLLLISTYEDGSIRAVTPYNSDVETGLSTDPDIVGAWASNSGAELDDETKQAIEDALKKDYAQYTEVSMLESQVVSGINYRVLCKSATEGGYTYAIATVYADLEGSTEVTEFAELG